MRTTPIRTRRNARRQEASEPLPPRDLNIAWANVGRSSPCHISILEIAFQESIDVLCVQEPYTIAGTRTSRHPGFDHYAPVEAWDSPTRWESERPRVMTYVRKDAGLRTKTGTYLHRDYLWLEIDGYSILNVYRQPLNHEALDYVLHLFPPPLSVIGGDFNVRHDTFEPGTASAHGGAELARWAIEQNLDYIGQPGRPTHRAGHTIDLTFSNVPFSRTTVRGDLHCGSDHETQVTVIPRRGALLAQHRHCLPESSLHKFAGLVELGVAHLPSPLQAADTAQLEQLAAALTAAIQDAMQTAGKVGRKGRAAPWWTPDCQAAHREHLRAREVSEAGVPDATRHFLTTVRNAKRAYWRNIIDGVKDDRDLYRVVGWHKLGPAATTVPLEVDGRTITDTMEKAEALRSAILDRFNADDDLDEEEYPPIEGPTLPWETYISIEEAERSTIGISSTSPGTDGITVRSLKACWHHIRHLVRGIYQRCLELRYFPTRWRLAEVAMMPKVGKKDRTSTRSWRPIALLSCLGKGLERIVAKRIAWTAMTHKVLSPQHGGALPKRSAMDLVAAFTHDVEAAWAKGRHISMLTMDVQGAFDAVLRNRLLRRMAQQGWPASLLDFVKCFLSDRTVRVRLGQDTTPVYPVKCGTPQGSPLSPVLYALYLAELMKADTTFRFGYADDINIYRATHSLDENVQKLAEDVRSINAWGQEHKIYFAPEKVELIHLTRQRGLYAPPVVVDDVLTINPVAPTGDNQAALRWLGVWFDRKLTFKRHVAERVAKARKVAQHIRGLAKTTCGPPADSLRKAVVTCVLPSLLYGAEAWYGGRTKPPSINRADCTKEVSARMGWHISALDKTLAIAARGVLPAWRTTPTAALFREAGLPSATVALEEAKLRHALRLRTVDENHPLAPRTRVPPIGRGRGAGNLQRPRTKVQRLAQLLPEVPRPILAPPHYSPGCRTDPTEGQGKAKAAAAFKKWWEQLPPYEVTIFTDGSEQYVEGAKRITYGYAVYQGGSQTATGRGSLHPCSHVFDGEAVGAWRGLAHALRDQPHRRVWLCIDSTSVIWCLRGAASPSSQWAFLRCHEALENFDVRVKWCPGHQGIQGNEEADRLAKEEAKDPHEPYEEASQPTISGIRSIARGTLHAVQGKWWTEKSPKLSQWYRQWELPYHPQDTPAELKLPRPVLARLLAIRTKHGDFAWYHRKFNHQDANLSCSCGSDKTPEHLVHCRKAAATFRNWPKRPHWPPSNRTEGLDYLKVLFNNPPSFRDLLQITEYYSKICTR